MIEQPTTESTMPTIWGLGFKLCRATFLRLFFFLLLTQLLGGIYTIVTHGQKLTLDYIKLHYMQVSIFGLVSAIISLSVYALMFHQLSTYFKGTPASITASLVLSLKKLPILLLAAIFMIIVAILATIALIIPVIYLFTPLLLYYPLIILDNEDPISAFKQSIKLVWGHWWLTSAVFAIPMTIVTLISVALIVITTILTTTLHLSNLYSLTIIFILMAIIQVFASIYYSSIIIVQLNDLKIRYKNKI